jgi:DNA-binding IclR family transcriptional regulator
VGLVEGRLSSWRLLTNHAYVLVQMSQQPGILIRELAERVGITERATQSILRDLADEGYVVVTKQGRRNSYEVQMDATLRHHLYGHITVEQLISALAQVPDS